MKRLVYTLAVLLSPFFVFSQNITGLWKGTIYNDSTKQALPYEVYICKESGKLTGYSHTCFAVDGKQYFGIKKVKVRQAKDGKIVILDDAMLTNNYPAIDKNVLQLNVLDLTGTEKDPVLDGPFETNRTKQYGILTGHINLKKADAGAESALMNYLQRSSNENGVTASN